MFYWRRLPNHAISVICTSISTGYMQTTGLADRSAEVGSETSIEVEHYYLTSINFMFETRRMNCFNRLYLSATDFAVSVTEQLGHINDASRISKTTFVSTSAFLLLLRQCIFSSYWNQQEF
ncbi:hypothetical protein DPMN_131022 [Dreissena polymorpha]|nr:hypothetical protein DPMN_131022 [Dreissena polymorpha]